MNLRSYIRKPALLAVGCALAAQGLVGVLQAPAANAAVWNCSTGYSSIGAWGSCGNSSTGYFKVNVLCQNSFTLGSYVKSGPRTAIGGVSVVTSCDNWYEHFTGNPWANTA